jgi:hypothetical protein
MKLSQLIERLQELHTTFGDINVVTEAWDSTRSFRGIAPLQAHDIKPHLARIVGPNLIGRKQEDHEEYQLQLQVPKFNT